MKRELVLIHCPFIQAGVNNISWLAGETLYIKVRELMDTHRYKLLSLSMMLTMSGSYGHVWTVLWCAELSVAEEQEGRIA